jgi:transposase
MSVGRKVVRAWQQLTKRQQLMIRVWSMRSGIAIRRNRAKVILGLVQGKSAATLAAGGVYSESQVHRIAKQFIEHGLAALVDRREDNGPNKVDEQYEARLLKILEGSPRDFGYARPTWTQELLILVMKQETGIKISRTTMSRVLKRLRVRLGRPKPIVNCPWTKAKKARRLRRIRCLLKNLPEDEVVVYVDEVDIHLNPKIGPDYMLPGQQREVITPGCNQKRYLAGALDPRTGKLIWVEGEQKNSLLFLQLLYHLKSRAYPQARTIHVILDNFKIHDSQQVRLTLASLKGKIRLHFLPPYCPDHNRIERTWKDLHDNVTRNHCCETMDQLMREVRSYLRNRNRRRQHAYNRADAA